MLEKMILTLSEEVDLAYGIKSRERRLGKRQGSREEHQRALETERRAMLLTNRKQLAGPEGFGAKDSRHPLFIGRVG